MMNRASLAVKRVSGHSSRLVSRTVTQFVAHPSANFERPTPIVLIGGEGCNHKIWCQLSKFLSNHGYGGAILEFPGQGTSFEEMANLLHKEVVQQKLTPPVLVAHSISTFVAQKYLESYALSGLILVNPIPPSATPALAALKSKWESSLRASQITSLESSSGEQLCDTLLRYYGLRGQHPQGVDGEADTALASRCTLTGTASQPFFSVDSVLRTALGGGNAEDTSVNLERGAVPTLMITSDGDGEVCSEQGLAALLRLHAVAEEEVVHFASRDEAHGTDVRAAQQSRAPMITHPEQFNKVVFDWIEAVT